MRIHSPEGPSFYAGCVVQRTTLRFPGLFEISRVTRVAVVGQEESVVGGGGQAVEEPEQVIARVKSPPQAGAGQGVKGGGLGTGFGGADEEPVLFPTAVGRMAFSTASIATWLWVGGFPSQSAPWAAPGTRGITLNPHSSGRGARIKLGRPVTADASESLPTWVWCDDMARVSWATRVLTVASGTPAALTMQGEDYQPPPLVVAGREDLVNFLDCERVASSPGRIDFFVGFTVPIGSKLRIPSIRAERQIMRAPLNTWRADVADSLAAAFPNYSCLSASMGSSLAARRAGMKPKRMPMAAEKTNEMILILGSKRKGAPTTSASMTHRP